MPRIIALLVAASLGLSAAAPAHCALAADVAAPSAAPADPSGADHHAAHAAHASHGSHGSHGSSGAESGESGEPSSGSPAGCPMLAVCAAAALPGVQQEQVTDVTRAVERMRSVNHSPSRADLGTDPPPPRPSPHV